MPSPKRDALMPGRPSRSWFGRTGQTCGGSVFGHRAAGRAARLAMVLPLAGCSDGVLDPAGPIAAANKLILLDSVGIMLAIVVPTILASLAFAWWFRASNTRARYQPDFAYSGRIELIVWSIPIMIILFLGGVIWVGSHELDPAQPIESPGKPIEVQVVSLDWKWLFIYPDFGVASVNQLVVPAGVPVHFSLTSSSVMNTFFVPRLGSMIYTMNGMVTQLNLQADHPGDYFGESGMFSGDGFSDMNFIMRAVPPGKFVDWIANVQKAGPALDPPEYIQLEKQSQHVKPFTYRAIDPGIFNAIVTQHLPPGPGPQEGHGGPKVRPVGGK
ncbi:MAG TPA: ubiquinol oxidase subunit II [Rhodopila sp.]|nr:ubiquinol oxidase subunit II [Rhodopila sp.]